MQTILEKYITHNYNSETKLFLNNLRTEIFRWRNTDIFVIEIVSDIYFVMIHYPSNMIKFNKTWIVLITFLFFYPKSLQISQNACVMEYIETRLGHSGTAAEITQISIFCQFLETNILRVVSLKIENNKQLQIIN